MLRYCLEIIPLKLTISEISQGNQVATRSCSFAPKTMINRQMERRTGRQTDRHLVVFVGVKLNVMSG